MSAPVNDPMDAARNVMAEAFQNLMRPPVKLPPPIVGADISCVAICNASLTTVDLSMDTEHLAPWHLLHAGGWLATAAMAVAL